MSIPIPIPIPFTFSLSFSFSLSVSLTFSFSFSFMIAFSLTVRISIIPTIPGPLSAALFFLYGSRHAGVVIHRVQDSLHQSLIRVRIVVLSRPMLWVSMVWMLVVRLFVINPATTFITHGSPWGVIR